MNQRQRLKRQAARFRAKGRAGSHISRFLREWAYNFKPKLNIKPTTARRKRVDQRPSPTSIEQFAKHSQKQTDCIREWMRPYSEMRLEMLVAEAKAQDAL